MNTKFTLAGLILLVIILLAWNPLFGTKTVTTTLNDPNGLPSIQIGELPWLPDVKNLRQRLAAIGLPALPTEGNALHIHQHLDLFINGKLTPIPADIGVNEIARFIAPIHTHDTTGVIHVESDRIQDFTLGQFFDIWGVRLTKDCIGGYCTNATSTLKMYINGSLVTEDPRKLVLTSHQQIVLMYGTEADMPRVIPSSYSFPPGE